MSEKDKKNNKQGNHHKIPDPAADEGTVPQDVPKDEAVETQGSDVVSLSKSEYEALKLKADERDGYLDKFVRAHAEFENAKRRMEKDRIDSMKYANDSFVLDFLPIADNLEKAERYIKEAKDFKAVQDGVNMIHLQIQKFLKDIGVERIKTVGEKFDPHMHDPLETEDAKENEEGVISAELQAGYKVNGRLLRPASVRVTKKQASASGEKGEAPAANPPA